MLGERGSPEGAPAFLTDPLGVMRNTQNQVEMVLHLRPSESNRDLPANRRMCRNWKKNESLEKSPLGVIPD